VTDATSLGLAFVAGLLGSGHCVGMCGGLVSACFLRLARFRRNVACHAAYHAARLAVYALAGAIAAGLGEVLPQTGRFGFAQGILQIVAGLALVALGLDLMGKLPFSLGVGFGPLAWSRRLLTAALDRGPIVGALLAGLANGLMPCALTLAMAIKATTAGAAVDGALLMLTFGAGTLPSMLGIGVASTRLSVAGRARLTMVAALVVIVMGTAMLVQGFAYTRVMGMLAF
jgi:sulfite exporter TauE/SafE